jgi:hypothetical protein
MISPPLLDTRAATSPDARDNAGVVAAKQLCSPISPRQFDRKFTGSDICQQNRFLTTR